MKKVNISGKAITKQDVIDMLWREINYLNGQAFSVNMKKEQKAEILAKVKELNEALEVLVWDDEK